MIWARAEVRKFLRTAASTRLHGAWRLSLYGLRRGEVLDGKRTLPVDDDLVAALVELRKREARESGVAGAAYGAALADLEIVRDRASQTRVGHPRIRPTNKAPTSRLLVGALFVAVSKRARSEGLEPPTF